jgi:hypothetical protein
LAGVASLVVTTIKQGDAEDHAALEAELAAMAGRVHPEEVDMHNFVAALRGVLQGEDSRRLVVKLRPPYRDAFLSLLQLLSAADTSEFALTNILDRIRHNTIVALTHGNAETRTAIAETLTDLQRKLLANHPAREHLALLIAGAQALLAGKEPPTAVNNLPEPFAETWRIMLAASKARE